MTNREGEPNIMSGIVDEIIEVHTVIAKDYLPRLKAALAAVEGGAYEALAVAKDIVRTIEGTVNGTVTNAAPTQAAQVQAPILSASVQELAAQQPEPEVVEPEADVEVDDDQAGAAQGAGEAAAATYAEAVAPAHKRASRTKHD